MSRVVISKSRLIDAPAADIFAVLSDAQRHSEFDGSGTVQGTANSQSIPLELGTKFGMSMKISFLPYRITNTVVEFSQDRLIAWNHFGGHVWRFELEENEEGTLVTESFDTTKALFPPMYGWTGYLDSHPGNIEASLERLAGIFEK